MLLDTSGLLILAHEREPRHALAREYLATAERVVTHNYVIDELVAIGTRRRLPRTQILDFIQALDSAEGVEIIYVDRDLHHAPLRLLRERPDKEWSLCDAVSFVVM